ncbi:heavy-metal-associated domain-containing protein [Lachnospiraceae bacterium 62-35]
MSTAVICLLLIGLAGVGAKSCVKRLVSGCCGASGRRRSKRIKVNDRNPGHYSCHKVLKIDGMACSNCAVTVENALNQREGLWAKVRLAEGEADVYMKQDMDDQELKDLIRSAGYLVYKIETKKH